MHRSPTPLEARVRLDPTDVVGTVSPRLFGSFVEHAGRAVHTGIHEPGHEHADAQGRRLDVLELVRELGVTMARYPGGNFVSAHDWEDSVGPPEQRPVRLDPAWHSLEDHSFGLHEFAAWAALAGVEVMYAVNLGTRGPREAARVLEYANHPGGTELSERRRAHGADEPFDIRLWCLGNEMDGPWQVGHKTADEYGRLAAETARLMRMVDPRVELVAAGSSNAEMPTFGAWERTVLRHTAGLVDHLSIHAYVQEHDGDLASFLASAVELTRYVEAVTAIVDEVAAETGVAPVGIALDEWNVWDQTYWNEVEQPALLATGWARAPRLLEQDYDVADAVVVGSLLGVLLRHCDRISMANLAQLVNVIAPIRTEPGGPAWVQTTYGPFQAVARTAGQLSLRPRVRCDLVPTARHGDVEVVDVAATLDARPHGPGTLTVFVTNRSPDRAVSTLLDVAAVVTTAHARCTTPPPGTRRGPTHDAQTQGATPYDLDDVGVTTAAGRSEISLTLPPLSWTALTLETDPRPDA